MIWLYFFLISSIKDYVEGDLYTRDPNTGFVYGLKQYRLNQKNSDNHKWYYFPNMTKSEAILFKVGNPCTMVQNSLTLRHFSTSLGVSEWATKPMSAVEYVSKASRAGQANELGMLARK